MARLQFPQMHVLIFLSALLSWVSAQRVFSLQNNCQNLFGPKCVPVTSASIGQTKECGDWKAKGWARGDVQQHLWIDRKVDQWLVNYVNDHPSLKTASLNQAPYGFYQELAKLTGHSWESTCNMIYECKISTGIPDACGTTDYLNGYLVLLALENVNRFFKLAREEGYNALIEFQLKLPKIRFDLKPDKTPVTRTHVDPAKLLNMGADLLRVIPTAGSALSFATKAIIGIYVNEPLKFVDTDLADLQDAFGALVSKHYDNVQRAFNAVMFESPTGDGGAINVLKGGGYLQQATLAQSNVNEIKKKMLVVLQTNFVSLVLNFYSIWIAVSKYYDNERCLLWKNAMEWGMEGETCFDNGYHVLPINYERSIFKTQRGEMRYEQADAIAKYVDVQTVYRQSIACDLDSTKCTGFTVPVIRYDRCLTVADGDRTVTNVMSKHDNGNVDERRDNIYCSVYTYAVSVGMKGPFNRDCQPLARKSLRSSTADGFDARPCVPHPWEGGNVVTPAARQKIYDIFHERNMTFPRDWGT